MSNLAALQPESEQAASEQTTSSRPGSSLSDSDESESEESGSESLKKALADDDNVLVLLRYPQLREEFW